MEKRSKQVIVLRNDLNMRKGKMIAQGAHAALGALLSIAKIWKPDASKEDAKFISSTRTIYSQPGSSLEDWLSGKFTKIVVYVNSEKELTELFNSAKEKGLICFMVTDAGLTEFKGIPTKTCCAIGPGWEDEVDAITRNLPLL